MGILGDFSFHQSSRNSPQAAWGRSPQPWKRTRVFWCSQGTVPSGAKAAAAQDRQEPRSCADLGTL